MPIDSTRLPVPNPQVIHRSLPDGAVLFSTADEVYYGLNVVASRAWELLPPRLSTVGELCEALAAEYPDADPDVVREDVLELLEHLHENALTVPAPARALHVDADAYATVALPAPAPAARRVG